jgi:O-antigen/teichoic acid export membrane protein
VFQPIEEIAFNLFSKYNKQQEGERSSLNVLAKIAQFLAVIGLGMIIFGFLFARLFIRTVYTEKWATDSAVEIMRAYCLYTCFMAINGVSEAYIYAKADKATLRKLQITLFLTSV